MKLRFLSILFILSLFSCNKNVELFEGDIYIKFINLYNIQSFVLKDKIEESKKVIINFDYKNKSNSEKELNDYYKTLIENDLFYKPLFQLKLKSEEIINVYVEEDEYLKLEKEIDNLDRYTEQIHVKFEGLKISNGINNRAIYSAKKIVFIEKTAGKTDWHK